VPDVEATMAKIPLSDHILAEELKYRSPEYVYSWLEGNTDYGLNNRDLIDRVLLRRGQPLIDLGLAKYSLSRFVVKRLFYRSKLLRSSVMTNPHVGPGTHHSWGRLISNEEVYDILARGETDTVGCLLENKTCSVNFLRSVATREEPFRSLAEKDWGLLIYHILQNPLVTQAKEVEYSFLQFDHDMDHRGLVKDLWELLSTVEPDPFWTLIYFDKIDSLPLAFSFDYDGVFQKWKEALPKVKPGLPEEDFLRGIARGIESSYPNVIEGASEIRMQFYQKMTQDEAEHIEEFLQLDGILFLENFYKNANFWRNEKGRSILASTSSVWRRKEEMSMSDGQMDWVYYETNQRKFEKECPEWFEESSLEDDQPSLDTRSEMDLMMSELPRQHRVLNQKVSELNWKVNILVFSVMVLILTLIWIN